MEKIKLTPTTNLEFWYGLDTAYTFGWDSALGAWTRLNCSEKPLSFKEGAASSLCLPSFQQQNTETQHLHDTQTLLFAIKILTYPIFKPRNSTYLKRRAQQQSPMITGSVEGGENTGTRSSPSALTPLQVLQHWLHKRKLGEKKWIWVN